MKHYELKSKIGKIISDWGLIGSFIGFIIFAVLHELTGNVMFGFNSVWLLAGSIIGYIDYKVEQLERSSYYRRMFLLDEITRMTQGIQKQQQPQQQAAETTECK